jgi:bifunctional enzyme CysN/CysC
VGAAPSVAPVETDLLRLSTAGSVDDGKSTLIGRLLYETREIFDDHLEAVERASVARGGDYVNLALLTDGLRAEREQGITIDVAYRHFATPRRRFILADTPGHVQYTRNMVTGTSTADLTIVLLDARRGITEQSRRHLFVAALLEVPHVVVCVNKLDLVDYSADVFHSLCAALDPLVTRLGLADVTFLPISALHGDNVASPSARMPWYTGPSLLEHLEHVRPSRRLANAARFPVQYVIRPMSHDHHDYRGYAGQVASGLLQVDDEVVVLPAGWRTRVTGIDTFDGPVEHAEPPLSVTVRLADELDISRGDLICTADEEPPLVSQDIEATVCWFSHTPIRPRGRYLLKHTTRSTRAVVQEVQSRVDVTTLSHDREDTLQLNDIGRIRLRTLLPLVYDPYVRNHATGSFILVDEHTNETVAAGVIS